MLLAVVASLASCSAPGPDIRDDEDVVVIVDRPSDGEVCQSAVERMERQDFVDAARLLREASVEVTDPEIELCLSRAVFGLGEFEEALSLAAPLAGAREVPRDTRAKACVLAAWASLSLGRDAEAAALIDRCEPSLEITPESVVLAADSANAAAVLTELRAGVEDNLGAFDSAVWLASDQTSEASEVRWAASRALVLAESLTDAERAELVASDNPVVAAALAYAAVQDSITRGAIEEATEALPALSDRLAALGLVSSANNLQDALARASAERPAVFGCILPLTGAQRQIGRAQLAGLLLAQGAFMPDEAPATMLLIFDSGEEGEHIEDAIAVLDNQNVLAVLGPYEPSLATEVARQAGLRGIPSVSMTLDQTVTDISQWTFQLFANPRAEARALLEVADQHSLRTVALAVPVPTPQYMNELMTAFEEGAGQFGITVLEPVNYLVDDLQSEAAMAAGILSGQGFDALLIPDVGGNATTLAAYLAAEGLWSRPPERTPSTDRREVVYLGNSFWHNPEFLASGPDYLAGGVFPSWMPSDEESHAADFVEVFESTYSRLPGILDAFAFDALALLKVLSADPAVRTRGALWLGLHHLDAGERVTGTIQFSEERQSTQEPRLFSVERGGFELR